MNYPIRYGGAIDRVARSGEFGFIDLHDGRTVFVHKAALVNSQVLVAGAQVTYLLRETERGLKAVDVEVIGGDEDRVQAALGASAGIG